ncbi:OmpA family protein [Propylenella binzhouense]|uniref:OmpA family protein n=1 Tax=Propylenella binzhouense TaxID=2555902 RepID=A0A964T9H3_9HYPH|nr:OmpA family protein [Propylenella binzhouense]MYZ50515.1 OmpA family protein [Propylenella binzhouense]
MRYVSLPSLFFSALVSTSALAGPAHNAEEIVQYFIKSADLGSARGICIGTAQECSRSLPEPVGLDMLIGFDLDSAELTADAQRSLGEFARALVDERLGAAKFVIEGYTDASGTETYNKGLSERRAASVRGFLLAHGVSEEKITAIGLGETRPRMEDPFDPGNRRVEMRINLQ